MHVLFALWLTIKNTITSAIHILQFSEFVPVRFVEYVKKEPPRRRIDGKNHGPDRDTKDRNKNRKEKYECSQVVHLKIKGLLSSTILSHIVLRFRNDVDIIGFN